ncbi:hypothetical protein [Spirillospora sp. NPDC048824]|uniref:hypothetical protein n=1 Tax=Spirillospora sp. NPDC048824 TaxID=3364526 RepID=UPI0037230EE1
MASDPRGDDDATSHDPPAGDATSHDPPAGDATSHDPPAGDAASRDPLGGAPRPDDPMPPPWTVSPQEPAQWESPPPGPPPDHTTHMPPSGETFTQLSPEPWADPVSPEPWAEPAIWQPPAPPKRSTVPYFLAAAGVVLLLGVALGIVFWPSGSETPAQPGGGVPSAQGQGTGPATEESGDGGDSDSGDVEAQAKAVDDLLEDMGTTRSELGGVVVDGCPTNGLRRILEMRMGQLERARELDVSALDNGVPMKDALVRALEASTESNQRYVDIAPGCPTEEEVSDVNQRASNAKSEFIGYWAPVAEQAGLPARTESDI